jgi:hypothetical protein
MSDPSQAGPGKLTSIRPNSDPRRGIMSCVTSVFDSRTELDRDRNVA